MIFNLSQIPFTKKLKEFLDISATLHVKRTNLAIKHAKQFFNTTELYEQQ